MSHSFDIVQRALFKVKDSGVLSEHDDAIISGVQQVIEEWHSVNHKFQDALNRGSVIDETVFILGVTVEEPNPVQRGERLAQYYKRG